MLACMTDNNANLTARESCKRLLDPYVLQARYTCCNATSKAPWNEKELVGTYRIRMMISVADEKLTVVADRMNTGAIAVRCM